MSVAPHQRSMSGRILRWLCQQDAGQPTNVVALAVGTSRRCCARRLGVLLSHGLVGRVDAPVSGGYGKWQWAATPAGVASTSGWPSVRARADASAAPSRYAKDVRLPKPGTLAGCLLKWLSQQLVGEGLLSAQIARRVGITQERCGASLARMRKQGLTQRVADPKPGRYGVYLWAATDAGRKLTQGWPEVQGCHGPLCDGARVYRGRAGEDDGAPLACAPAPDLRSASVWAWAA